jgi:hypothetical protein
MTTIIDAPVDITINLEDDIFHTTLSGDGSAINNLNASNLAFGIVSSNLIYGNTLSNISASNIVGSVPSIVSGNTLSNISASNLAFGIVNSSLIYGNQISNINSSNITQPFATANIGTLNVSSATTMSGLTVGGPIISTNTSNFANLFVSNLTVTGNFIVTATNTTVTNSLSITNQGTTTALYVNQNEAPNMTYNVAEFWDHTQLAMVIDGYGNVAVHTASSPGYAFTVVQGASIDNLSVSTVSGGTITASTGFTRAAFTGGTFQGSTITASTGFTGAAFTGGTFQGSTITASTGFTGAAFSGGSLNITGLSSLGQFRPGLLAGNVRNIFWGTTSTASVNPGPVNDSVTFASALAGTSYNVFMQPRYAASLTLFTATTNVKSTTGFSFYGYRVAGVGSTAGWDWMVIDYN